MQSAHVLDRDLTPRTLSEVRNGQAWARQRTCETSPAVATVALFSSFSPLYALQGYVGTLPPSLARKFSASWDGAASAAHSTCPRHPHRNAALRFFWIRGFRTLRYEPERDLQRASRPPRLATPLDRCSLGPRARTPPETRAILVVFPENTVSD